MTSPYSHNSNDAAGEEYTFEQSRQQTRSFEDSSSSDSSAATLKANNATVAPVEGRKRRILCYAMAGCVAVICGIALLFVYGVLDNSHVPQGFFDSDPFGGRVKAGNPEDAHAWKNGGSGLELFVLNAVDESWQSFFTEGVAVWENGTPDALTLPTRKVQPESKCDPSTGVLKVCNGDYGETGWKGLNTIILDRASRDIFASAAMMNDWYLSADNFVERTYTMCHEIGHGFGLPHWDENFWNRDLGNCMDYTNSPQNNQKPDTSNFEFLSAMYGEVGVVPPPTGNTGGSGNGSSSNNAKNKNKDKNKDKDEKDRRQLQLRGSSSPSPSSSMASELSSRSLLMEALPADLLEAYRNHVGQLLLDPESADGATIVHNDANGLGLTFDLGYGILMEAHMLKA